MPKIPGFEYTMELVCHGTICITVTLLPYWERKYIGKLITCNKIKYDTAVVNAINNAFNKYYKQKGGYNEAQYSSKEFMINLTSKHENIVLHSGYLFCYRSSEKRFELVSKGCLFKVDNYIFNKNPQEIESYFSMSDWTVILYQSDCATH